MPLSPQEAAQALHEIEQTQSRSKILRGYQGGAPHFLMWAALWAVGYGLSYLAPTRAGTIWIVVIAIGAVAGVAVLMRSKGAAPAWRYAAGFATLTAFSLATLLVLPPRTARKSRPSCHSWWRWPMCSRACGGARASS